MSERAAFDATYFTHKPIVTRKCVQLVFEVPEERLLDVLRMLQPKAGEQQVMVAIARLNETAGDLPVQDGDAGCSFAPSRPAASPSAPKKAWAELPASQQAAIRCGEASFMRFLESRYDACRGEDAAAIVRELCWVPSRKELDTNSAARGLWRQIDTDYLVWSGKLAEPR